MSAEERDKIQKNKLAARRTVLQRKDLVDFTYVPDFIINSFFGSCNYKNRLHVSTFCYVNGINFEGLLKLIHWNDVRDCEIQKVKSLMTVDYEKDQYRQKYYSYCTRRKLVVYLNGNVRYFGISSCQ